MQFNRPGLPTFRRSLHVLLGANGVSRLRGFVGEARAVSSHDLLSPARASLRAIEEEIT